MRSIHFVNQNIGYAVTRVDGYFIKTTNGGTNWNLIFFSPYSFESIFFIDSLTGWAAGTSGGGWVFRTTNGGTSWDSVMVTGGSSGYVYFLNIQTGWLSSGPFIYKSTDGGVNWTLLFDTGGATIAEFSFVNQNTGWLVTDTWKVFKTTNSGNNWLLLDTLPGFVGSHSIFFSSLNTGWICGDGGYMFSTTNGGQDWYRQQTNTGNFLSSVVFLTDSIGWAVGGGGRIIYTNSSGQIVRIEKVENISPIDFQLYQNFPNPFNSVTKIKYDIPSECFVTVKVYNILGELLITLINGQEKPGRYSVTFNGSNYPSGVYIYKIEAGAFTQVKKMILIK